MRGPSLRQAIEDFVVDFDEEIRLADGFDEAFLGLVTRCSKEPIACYDYDSCIAILMRHGMNYDQAVEYFEFNVIGAWVGEYTPCFLNRPPFDIPAVEIPEASDTGPEGEDL